MDKEAKEVELLKVYLDYSKTYAIAFMSAVIITGFYLMQLDENDYWTQKHWTYIIFLVAFVFGLFHFVKKHEVRQKELVNKLKE